MRRKPVVAGRPAGPQVVRCNCGRVFQQNYREHVVCDLDCPDRRGFLDGFAVEYPWLLNPDLVHHTAR